MARAAGATRRRRDGRPVETIPDEAREAEVPPASGTAASGGLGPAVLGPVAGGALAAGQVLNVSRLAAPEAIALSGAAILSSFERFLDSRALVTEADVNDLLEEEYGDVPEETRLEAVDTEIQRDRVFRAKARARLDRDLPRVLQIPDPAVSQTELLKVLERERRYAEQREQAIALRSLGNVEARIVEAASPEGAYWWPSPHVAEHTLDCLAMGWKVWPWTVLRTYHPPLHGGCPCELKTIREAQRLGLPGADLRPNPEMAFHAMQIQEAPWDPEELEEELRVLEARYDNRWGAAGGSKRGQFRPRRGGVPGRIGARGRRRKRRALMEVIPAILGPGQEATVVRRKAASLNVDDEVFVNGKWQRVWGLPSDREGVVDLEDDGPIYIDPDVEINVRVDDPVREPHSPRPEKPPAGVPTYADAAKVATMKKPDSAGELAPGFAFTGEKGRAKTDGDTLMLPEGFFTLGRKQRESVVFRHLGRRLRDTIPAERRRELERDHPELKGKRFEDSYLALNTELGDRLRDLHPEAMAELAREARVHGFPLRDDVDDWMERREDDDSGSRPDPLEEFEREHDTRRIENERLAERIQTMTYGEASSLLIEAGYSEDYDSEPRVWRNFNRRSQIVHGFEDPNVSAPKLADVKARELEDVYDFVDEGKWPPFVDEKMTAEGFGAATSMHRDDEVGTYWMQYVHPDGRGVAIEFRINKGGERDQSSGDAVEFFATERERHNAKRQVVSADPIKGIELGDDFGYVEQLLGPMSGWRQAARRNGRDSGMPEDWAGYVDYQRVTATGEDRELVRVAYSKFTTGGTETVKASELKPGDRITVSHASAGDPWRIVKAEPGVGGRGVSLLLERKGERIGWGRMKNDEVERHMGGGGKVVALGRPNNALDMDETDVSIIDEATYRENERLRRQKVEEERARVKAREEAGDAAMLELLGRRSKKDKAAIDRELRGRDTNAVVVGLRDKHNWQIVGARRGRSKGDRIVTYTLRSPEGDTLRIQGGLTFGDRDVRAVTGWDPAKQIDRERIRGRVPDSIAEWEKDSLGRVDELAERFDAVGHVSTILYSKKRGTSAHREWNGTVVMGQDVKPFIENYLTKKKGGEALSDRELLNAYDALETMQHEINHGVTAPGGERSTSARNAGSFTPADYKGPGKAWEEALTEEAAHVLTVDWLRSWGATDILEAVKRNPNDERVKGVYRAYRRNFGHALDEAQVPAGDRADLILDWKFRKTPPERYTELGKRLRAAGAPKADRMDMRTGQPMDDKTVGYWAAGGDTDRWLRDFEPIVRPDLSDVELPAATAEEGDTIAAWIDGIEFNVRVEEVLEGDRYRVSGAGKTNDSIIEARDVTRVFPKRPTGGWTAKSADDRTLRESSLVQVGVWDYEANDLVKVEGRVVEVMAGGQYVRVELEDGTVLWYSVTRVWGGDPSMFKRREGA